MTLLSAPAFAQLDEVITTAQKRTENVQNVPISVDTLDGDDFAALQIGGEDILALAARIPGVYAESSNGRLAPRFYIRGLGNVDFDLAASQPVSIIIDDVVQENVLLKSSPIFDSERVEVLRGPQGTLFGRNTPAGIIKFDSRRPTQEVTGNAKFSYGSFNTIHAEGGVGGALVDDKVSARASVLFRRRSDYIDNAQLNTPGDDLGQFEEFAGRLQLLFTPSETVDVLLNAHGRTYDGTAAIFRANIIQRGSDQLIPDFDRDTVNFDGGNDNSAEADTYGFSGRIDADMGNVTLTSITGYEAGKSRSVGDIDGGFVGPNSFFDPTMAPNPLTADTIAFPAETQDSLDGLTQFTQELRFASNSGGQFNWQAGLYYFDTSFDVITVGPGFPPLTTVSHGNEAWSIFGQASYEVSDRVTLTGGLRYTDDKRTFDAPSPPPFVTVNPTEISDDEISWDISALYKASESVNLYARVARGFRGPTIQGRDVAFAAFSGAVDPQTVAVSETIQSYEVGFKSELADNRVRLNAAAFYYNIDDQQLSIIGGLTNSNQVINADKGVGYGFEADLEFVVSDNLFVQAGFSYNDTEIQDATLATATCASGLCTPTDPQNALGQALIDGNPFPNAPKTTFNAFAEYTAPLANDGELFINTDWAVQGETNFLLYETEEFRSSGNVEGGMQVGYRTADGRYSAAIYVRNITDAENLKGGIDFNNLTGFVNEPRVIGAALSANF
jgi:outer membrane receptor protein involved in Fe transport